MDWECIKIYGLEKELKTWIKYHKEKIEKDKEVIKKLKDSLELERYARENYLMKKENEDIYIIEFDTIKDQWKNICSTNLKMSLPKLGKQKFLV